MSDRKNSPIPPSRKWLNAAQRLENALDGIALPTRRGGRALRGEAAWARALVTRVIRGQAKASEFAEVLRELDRLPQAAREFEVSPHSLAMMDEYVRQLEERFVIQEEPAFQ